MKILTIFLIVLIVGTTSVQAQDVTANANALANKIAVKLKDSLSLSEGQTAQLRAINLKLHDEKMDMRQRHSGGSDLGKYLQLVENTRDSLYKAVLTESQFLLYRQKKRSLVSAN